MCRIAPASALLLSRSAEHIAAADQVVSWRVYGLNWASVNATYLRTLDVLSKGPAVNCCDRLRVACRLPMLSLSFACHVAGTTICASPNVNLFCCALED